MSMIKITLRYGLDMTFTLEEAQHLRDNLDSEIEAARGTRNTSAIRKAACQRDGCNSADLVGDSAYCERHEADRWTLYVGTTFDPSPRKCVCRRWKSTGSPEHHTSCRILDEPKCVGMTRAEAFAEFGPRRAP